MQVMKAIVNYDIKREVVGLSAYNTIKNFEGLLRRGKQNVLTKSRSQLVSAAMRISFITAQIQYFIPCL